MLSQSAGIRARNALRDELRMLERELRWTNETLRAYSVYPGPQRTEFKCILNRRDRLRQRRDSTVEAIKEIRDWTWTGDPVVLGESA